MLAHASLRPMLELDADELAYLAEYTRQRQMVLSVPHFAPPTVPGRGVLRVLRSLEEQGYVIPVPNHPMPQSRRLTEAGIEHCGGLTVFAR